jgi:protoporphyrinogen oxidase
MRTPTLDVAIVGAGLTGLAAARRAIELGLRAEVFEASDGVGGRVRSDRINGFICDRGFQLVNPSYPALSRYYPKELLGSDSFHRLPRGVDVVMGERVHHLGDPRASLAFLKGDLSSATGSIAEKLRFARYLLAISRGRESERGISTSDDSSFESEMLDLGVGTFYSRVIGPFASGVFLNLPSRVSARVARELIHYFLIGQPGLPRGGVGEVSKLLAQGVEVHLRTPVDEISDHYIRIGRRKVTSRAVIVATDPISLESLVPVDSSGRRKRVTYASTMSASTTWYHSVEGDDFPQLLRIDGGGGGPITNTIAISRLAPEYTPEGKTLISTTVMSAYGQEVSEARVRRHLSELWKRDTSSWGLVAKYSIPKSLPLLAPGTPRQFSLALPVKRGSMLRYIAGDYLALPAQQGAMESGIDAAEEIAARL